MSWTPTFIIKKEEIIKAIEKVDNEMEKYLNWEDDVKQEVEAIVDKEVSKLKKSNEQLNNPINDSDIKKLAEENVKSKTQKIWIKIHNEKEQKKGYLYNKLIEIKDEIDSEDLVIEKVSYIYCYTEFSSEAYTLKDFLIKNGVTYFTLGG